MAGLGFHSQENWFVARLNESDSAGKPAICPKDRFKPPCGSDSVWRRRGRTP